MKQHQDVLLVEDDPTSRAFLAAALQRMPSRVFLAGDVAGALDEIRRCPDAMLLVDAHLPDGSGIELLEALRASGACGVALAHTASTDPGLHARLRGAGFVAVLVKPLSADRLLAGVRAATATGPGCAPGMPDRTPAEPGEPGCVRPVWDFEAALRAVGGRQAHVDALRGLFLDELPTVRARVRDAVLRLDDAGLHAELHRLRAGCGFVGAARLAATVRALQHEPGRLPLADFEAAVDATLAATDG